MIEKEINILIVDDAKLDRNILVKIIQKYTDYNTATVGTGNDALEYIKNNTLDLILLDIVMPDINGFDLALELKKNDKTKFIPIIFITSLKDDESKSKAFSVGGIDYITKPFSQKEVISRITAQIELNEQYKEIKSLHSQIMYEMSIAKAIQNAIMPQKTFAFNNLFVECKYIPLEIVGGDYFDVIEISENIYIIFLADITGHGIPASLYTMMLKTNILYLTKSFSSPAVIMNELNKDLSELLLEDFFPTAVALQIDLNQMKMTFTNAAHPTPFYFSSKENKINKLINKNFALGLEPNLEMTEECIDIKQGDRIYLYTDGLINIEDKEGKYIETNFISEILEAKSKLTIKEQLFDIIWKIKSKTKDNYFEDDVTLLGIEIL